MDSGANDSELVQNIFNRAIIGVEITGPEITYVSPTSRLQLVLRLPVLMQNHANIVEQKHKTKQTIGDKSLQEIPCTPRNKSFYNHVFSFHLVQFAHSKVIQHPQKVIYKRSQTL